MERQKMTLIKEIPKTTRTPKLLSHQKSQPKIHQVLPIHQKSIESMGLVDLPTWLVDLYCKFVDFVGEYTRPMDPQYRIWKRLVKVLIFCFVKDLIYNSPLCWPRSCPDQASQNGQLEKSFGRTPWQGVQCYCCKLWAVWSSHLAAFEQKKLRFYSLVWFV